jgi:hypothetical protein
MRATCRRRRLANGQRQDHCRDIDLETVRNNLRSEIAVFKIPERCTWPFYDAIPRNAMGKVSKKVGCCGADLAASDKLTHGIALAATGSGSLPSEVDFRSTLFVTFVRIENDGMNSTTTSILH